MTDWDPDRATSPYGSPLDQSASGAIDDAPTYVIEEITRYVQHSLGNHGVPGQVTCRGGRLFLSTDAHGVGVAIFPWASRWPVTDEVARQRRAAEAARVLSEGRAASVRPSRPVRRLVIDPKLFVAVLVLLACGLYIAWEEGDAPTSTEATIDRRDDTPSPRAGAESPIEKEAATTGRTLDEQRLSRVCATTKARVYQGGSVSVADADGWQVEVAMLRVGGSEPLHTHPALKKYLADPMSPEGSKFIWKEEPNLAPIDTSDSLVTVQRTTIGEGAGRIEGVTLAFRGALVDSYFKQDGRARYFHIAHSLSEDLQVTHTGLYARCFDDPTHALGGWFRGLDAPGVSTALLYFMGTFAKPMHIAKPFYSKPSEDDINRLHAFDSIKEGTKALDRAALSTLVGSEGGMATGKTNEPVIITFPFRDGNRASRTSRSMARVTSLGR